MVEKEDIQKSYLEDFFDYFEKLEENTPDTEKEDIEEPSEEKKLESEQSEEEQEEPVRYEEITRKKDHNKHIKTNAKSGHKEEGTIERADGKQTFSHGETVEDELFLNQEEREVDVVTRNDMSEQQEYHQELLAQKKEDEEKLKQSRKKDKLSRDNAALYETSNQRQKETIENKTDHSSNTTTVYSEALERDIEENHNFIDVALNHEKNADDTSVQDKENEIDNKKTDGATKRKAKPKKEKRIPYLKAENQATKHLDEAAVPQTAFANNIYNDETKAEKAKKANAEQLAKEALNLHTGLPEEENEKQIQRVYIGKNNEEQISDVENLKEQINPDKIIKIGKELTNPYEEIQKNKNIGIAVEKHQSSNISVAIEAATKIKDDKTAEDNASDLVRKTTKVFGKKAEDFLAKTINQTPATDYVVEIDGSPEIKIVSEKDFLAKTANINKNEVLLSEQLRDIKKGLAQREVENNKSTKQQDKIKTTKGLTPNKKSKQKLTNLSENGSDTANISGVEVQFKKASEVQKTDITKNITRKKVDANKYISQESPTTHHLNKPPPSSSKSSVIQPRDISQNINELKNLEKNSGLLREIGGVGGGLIAGIAGELSQKNSDKKRESTNSSTLVAPVNNLRKHLEKEYAKAPHRNSEKGIINATQNNAKNSNKKDATKENANAEKKININEKKLRVGTRLGDNFHNNKLQKKQTGDNLSGIQKLNTEIKGIRQNKRDDILLKGKYTETQKTTLKTNATEEYYEVVKARSGAIKLNRIEKNQADGTQNATPESLFKNKMDSKSEALARRTKEKLSAKNSKMSLGNSSKISTSNGALASQTNNALQNSATVRKFLTKSGFGQLMGASATIGPQAKIIQAVAKKAISALMLAGITIGSFVGGGTLIQRSGISGTEGSWSPVAAATYLEPDKEDSKTLTQEASEMVQVRLKCYYMMAKKQKPSEQDLKDAGSEIVPLKDFKIKSVKVDGEEIESSEMTLDDINKYQKPHTYTGTMKWEGTDREEASSHTENISATSPQIKLDFVDRDGKTIGKDYFILNSSSDLTFPDGSKGDGAKQNNESSGTAPPNNNQNSNTGVAHENGQTQMDIMLNMIGALETGGQVYGQRDYANFINAEQGAEVTATLGWSSFYGVNGRNYLQRFQQENPALFSSIDASGEVAPVLNIDWEGSHWQASSSQRDTIVRMLTSPEGMKLQDTMTAERLLKHWNYCAQNYTTNMRAIMWYTQLAELGGGDYSDSPVDNVFQACNGDYSSDNIYNCLKARNGSTYSLGGSAYDRRHSLFKEWVEYYVPADEVVDLNNVQVTGAGAIFSEQSGGASNINMIAGQTLFVKEMLSLAAMGSYYAEPDKREDYLKYCLDMVDFAVTGDENNKNVEVEYKTVAGGGLTEWSDGEGGKASDTTKKLSATVKIPIMCDLYILEKNDNNFKNSWDLSSEKHGDKVPHSYLALPSSDFEKVFNVKVKILPLGGGGSSGVNTNGISNLPYVQWAIMIANDDSHGYSQNPRDGNPDYDCSSFVFYALTQAGFYVGDYAFTANRMEAPLTAVGFTRYEVTSLEDMQPGDILVYPGGAHTEIYIGNDQTVGAHSAEDGGDYGVPGDQTGKEIYVGPCLWTRWDHGFHPPKDYHPM